MGHPRWHCDCLRVAVRLLVVYLLLLGPSSSAGLGTPGAGRRLAGEEEESGTADAGLEAPPPPPPGGGGKAEGEKETIAHILDEALKHEFKEEEDKRVDEGKIFNETAKTAEAKPETVLLITSKKKDSSGGSSSNHTAAAGSGSAKERGEGDKGGAGGGADKGAGGGESDGGEEGTGEGEGETKKKEKIELNVESDVDRIIDSRDNEYVLSKPNEEGSMGLTLDPQLVRDLCILISASALAGVVMELLGQPTINGYFIAGSLVGPGGLKLVKELVQVQSMAQLGVQLLLFSLGLEFSLSRLSAMRNVALLGGLLQIMLMAVLASVAALFIGASPYQGAFLGALVSMSSTSIVVKCLNDKRQQSAVSTQITIATLVLQDCVVGLLFAFMPVIASAAEGGPVSALALASVLGRMAVVLVATVASAALLARTVLPVLMRRLARHSAETYQMVSIAFCLLTALAGVRLGVSSELGAFMAGVMVSATDQQEQMQHQLEPITHFFVALFIASIGLILSPIFLLNHLTVLAAGVSVVVIAKTALFGGVVWLFRYPPDVALSVGINLAQIGEFGFVLLSVANQYGLIPSQVYMLLMGVTALSLLLTPSMLQASQRIMPRPRPSMLSLELSRELTGLKRYPSGSSARGGGGGDGAHSMHSMPSSPLVGTPLDTGDVLLKLQGQTGHELGHRHVRSAATVIPVVVSPRSGEARPAARLTLRSSGDDLRSLAHLGGHHAGSGPLPHHLGRSYSGSSAPV